MPKVTLVNDQTGERRTLEAPTQEELQVKVDALVGAPGPTSVPQQFGAGLVEGAVGVPESLTELAMRPFGGMPGRPVTGPLMQYMAERFNAPGMLEDPQTTPQRYARRVGEGVGAGAVAAPAVGALSGPGAVAIEMGLAGTTPVVGEYVSQRTESPWAGIGAEMATGMAAGPLMVARAGTRGAAGAAETAARRAGETPLTSRAAERAARRLQADVGSPWTREAAIEALEQAGETTTREGVPSPITAQVMGAAEVPGSRLQSLTRAMENMGTDFTQEIGERTGRARQAATELVETARPEGTPGAVREGFAASADEAREAARRLYQEVPEGISVPLENAQRSLQDVVAEAPVANAATLREAIGSELELLDALATRYDNAPPLNEVSAVLSRVKAKLADMTRNRQAGVHLVGQVHDALENAVGTGMDAITDPQARARAQAAWAAYRQTYTPRRPGVLASEDSWTAFRTAQALQAERGTVNRIIRSARPNEVARQTRAAIGDNPQAMRDLKAAFWDHAFYNEAGDARGLTALRRMMQNPRFRSVYQSLFGDQDWNRARRVAEYYAAANYGDFGRAGQAFATKSGQIADVLAEGAETALSPDKTRMAVRLMARAREYMGPGAARLYREALLDPQLAAAFLRVDLTPERWAQNVRALAARRGIQILGEEGAD